MLKIEVISKAVHPSGQPLKFGSQRSGGDSMSTSPRFLGVPLTEGAISPPSVSICFEPGHNEPCLFKRPRENSVVY